MSLTFAEFIKQINNIATESGLETINSHKSLTPSLLIICNDTDTEYEVESVEPTMLAGCNCWSGAVIYLTRRL